MSISLAAVIFVIIPALLAISSPTQTGDARSSVDGGAAGVDGDAGAAGAGGRNGDEGTARDREVDQGRYVTAAPEPPVEPSRLPVERLESSPSLPRTPLLGEVAGLELHVPVRRAEVIGYHQASTRIAQQVLPIGRSTANRNTTGSVTPPDDHRGAPYIIMASRGRGSPGTSAVDVAARPGVAVVAPVTGTVTDVRSYWLYGSFLDQRIEIRPDIAPDLRVVLVHVDGLRVVTGDRVKAGRTALGEQVRVFPFASQIDRETDPQRFGHVHLEVQPFGARRPGDPWD